MDQASQSADDPLLTSGEVAEILGVDPNTVINWANKGKLRAIRTPSGHRRYRHSELNDAIAKANNAAANACLGKRTPRHLRSNIPAGCSH